MIYRKMYLYGILFEICMSLLEFFVPCVVMFCLYGDFIYPDVTSLSNTHWFLLQFISSFFSILIHTFLGYFGNALYYWVIKKKIQKGYHLLDKYRPTSVSALFMPFGLLVCFADWFSNRKKLKEHSENEVNEKSIRAYLNPNKENSRASKIANVSVFLMIILTAKLFFSIATTIMKESAQMNASIKNIVENADDMPSQNNAHISLKPSND